MVEDSDSEDEVATDEKADPHGDALRERAEALLARESGHEKPSPDAAVLHELSVHRIELDMQNEELRRSSDALARSRDAYRELYDFAPVGYLILDERGYCLEGNRTAARLLGVSRDLLAGLPLTGLLAGEEADRLSLYLRRVLTEATVQPFEIELARREGDTVYLRLDSVAAPGVTGPVCRTVLTDVSERRRLLDELRDLNRDLEQRVAERTAALRATNERLVRELNARRTIEDELVAARKLEAVGRLAGGVAHDFNNLLTIMQLELPMISAGVAGDPALERSAGEMAEAVERAAAVTSKLLAFARREVIHPEPLDPASVLREMQPTLRRLLPTEIELVVAVPEAQTWLMADRAGLERVLLNLVVNARDAITNAGRVAIVVDDVTVGADRAEGNGARPGDYVRITVTDTGCGMDREELALIFEPFYTTKDGRHGSGLGLATVHGIVTQAGGFVDVQSAPGQGTSMAVYLPRDGSRPAPEAGRPASRPRGGDETLILVDDLLPVRSALARVLRGAGYTVVEAGSSAECLEIVGSRSGPVQLVISDVIMPGVNGVELAHQLRDRDPALPIILMSGYIDDAIVDEQFHFLQKPFEPDVLLRVVREALDAVAPTEALR